VVIGTSISVAVAVAVAVAVTVCAGGGGCDGALLPRHLAVLPMRLRRLRMMTFLLPALVCALAIAWPPPLTVLLLLLLLLYASAVSVHVRRTWRDPLLRGRGNLFQRLKPPELVVPDLWGEKKEEE
jgi:hypothetical protein